MKSRKKGIIVFLCIAFGVAWVPLVIQYFLGLRSLNDQATFWDYVIFTVLTIPTSFAPALAALIVRRWVTREGFVDAGLHLNFRSGWRYYMVALFYPILIVAIALFLVMLTRPGQINYSSMKIPTILQMGIMAIVSTPVIWGEEFGWRGYLQIRLFAENPLLAATATGVIWGVWHYPMILLGFLFSGNPMGLVLYPVNMVITSILYGWLFSRSRSIWVASLAHAAGNTIINPLLGSLLPNVDWPIVWAGYRLVGFVVLCVILISLKGRSRRESGLSYVS